MKKRLFFILVSLLAILSTLTGCVDSSGYPLDLNGNSPGEPLQVEVAGLDIDVVDLPDQTGHGGEYLTTNGTDTSWASVNATANVTTDHAALSNLDYASSGHTGFAASGDVVTDHGALTGLSDDDHTQYLLADGTRALTGDLDFATYKAIALACDNGATLPASPEIGQWYLYTPTGRNVLTQFDGTNWVNIISIGNMTLYVDNTDGTDNAAHGTAIDGDAFKTIQYAISTIPGLVGGNVTININGETYSETVTIQGKIPTGNYKITLQGTLTAHATNAQESAVQGATSTFGSITDTGVFTNHAGDLLYSSNNAEYRIIDSATDNVGTIVGYWTATPSGNYTIYQWSTTITALLVADGQINVYCYDIYFNGGVTGNPNSTLYLLRCKAIKTGHAVSTLKSYANLDTCYVPQNTTSGYSVFASQGSTVVIGRSKIDQLAALIAIGADHVSVIILSNPCSIDGNSKTCLRGIAADSEAEISCELQYHKIRNHATGVYAAGGGHVLNTANNQYSNNTANENAIAASFSYID